MKASIAIAAELRGRIAGGTLRPGASLPVEDELTAEFGCSKPVVREALRILETEGLLEIRRGLGGGAKVRHPSIGHAARGMGVYLQIGDVPVLDVWEARDRIVAAAIERLAAGQVELVALDVEVAALVDVIGDLDGFNEQMLDVAEVAVGLAGSATEHLLVAALRHIVGAEIAAASARVRREEDLVQVRHEQAAVTDGWSRTLRHVRAGHAAAARAAYEGQAETLRSLVASGVHGLTVGSARAR